MPRRYKRTTDRGRAPRDILQRAAQAVHEGSSIRSAARDFQVDRMTLKRFIVKRADNPDAVTGYENCKLRNLVFPPVMEEDLAGHIKDMSTRFHGLTKEKCLTLIYEFAIRNQLKVPDRWEEQRKAGQTFWVAFKERQHLAIRAPEATSLARATAFNRFTVATFYNNLAQVMDRHHFGPHQIYNLDETGCTTVQNPGNVVSEQGVKQVGSVTSAERGQLVTVVYTISASGTVLPPMFIFPRVNFRDHFLNNAPNGSIGKATKSGWMNEELFLPYLEHVINHTRCSVDQKILLILDNHESHVSLAAIDLAEQHGIVLLTIPPHTSHKLQPLDRTCYGPFKLAYSRALDGWMRSNIGKTVTIYDIPGLVTEAQLTAMVPRNIISGFRSTGIYPFNRDVFGDIDYAPADVTDRELPRVEPPNGVPADGEQGGQGAGEPPNDVPADREQGDQVGEPLNAIPANGERGDQGGELPNRDGVPVGVQLVNRAGYISPSDILPLPKAGPRKTNKSSRRKGSTKILTNTPVRDEIAAAQSTRQQKKKKTTTDPKKAKKSLFDQKKTQSKSARKQTPISSDSESDVDLELMDESDSAPDEDPLQDIMEGDYIIVRVSAKARVCNYVARVDVIDGEDIEGIFLRRVGSGLARGRSPVDQLTFVLNPDDEASFPRDDIIKKLPTPTFVGTTSRCANQMKFPCNLDKWDLQ